MCDIFFRQLWKYKPQLCGLMVDAKPREKITLNYTVCLPQTIVSTFFPNEDDLTKPRLRDGAETLHVDTGALFVIQSTVHVIAINYRQFLWHISDMLHPR